MALAALAAVVWAEALPAQTDPWMQTEKLTASDGASFDNFGSAVAMSGDTAIIGAASDDDGGGNSGSAYIFRPAGGVWQEVAKLTASDGAASDAFGSAVALTEGTAIVGAVDAEPAGAAYIFREMGGVWQELAKLTASDGESLDGFGIRVAIDGDTAVVGAWGADAPDFNSGAAYVFREIGGVWQEETKLTASDGQAQDRFGGRVAISGDTIVVGAHQDDDLGSNSGSAYIFRRVGGVWQEEAKLTASDGASHNVFGSAVAVSFDAAVVGAVGADPAGAAYVFRELGGVWEEIAKLAPSDDPSNAGFATAVAISGGTVVVGSPWDNPLGFDSGSAYIFHEIGGVWQEITKLTASDGASNDNFGIAVAIGGGTALVAAWHNGEKGAAYAFAPTPCPPNLNGDTVLDLFDVLAFVNLFNAQDPLADFNDDGALDLFDFLAFTNAFNAGC